MIAGPRIPIDETIVDGPVLIASCIGDEDTGGGLVAIDGDSTEVIDRISTTGLAVSEKQFFRLPRAEWTSRGSSELLVYDDEGIVRYLRLDELRNAHDAYWDGNLLAIVSTGTNSIIWVNSAGEIVHRFVAPGEGDAWHLNSIVETGGELYATAFTQNTRNRGWEHEDATNGILFHLDSGRVLLSGLARPHHPRFIDGDWVLCNSYNAEVIALSEAHGRVVRRVELASWTRGIAVSDEFLFVGESRPRRNRALTRDSFDRARVAVIDRHSWKLVDRISLEMSEIYDLVFVNRALLNGVKIGFHTNQRRVHEQDQHAMFREVGINPFRLWVVTDPLPAEACRVKVAVEAPEELRNGDEAELTCSITNLGSAILASVLPHPIHISYRWLDPEGSASITEFDGRRSRLPRPLPPGDSVRGVVTVDVTPPPGEYLLRITLVQEFVAWFDELEAGNSITIPVTIRASDASSST